ncbi:MAG: hypothetical protein J6A17_04495 [Bacilli bacterium]|nr:hypothetical protein [Bacilli bacterium]
MKLRYFLKEKLNLSNGYIIAIVALVLVVIIGGSYALFTTTSEGKGALNIVTGDLKTYFESEQLDSDNEVVVAPNEVKTVIIAMKNVNPIDAKYNLYYSVNNATADVEVGYLTTGDEAPATTGYTIAKSTTKTIKVRIFNKHTENVTLKFGSAVGLTNDNLAFPTGKSSIGKVESNVIEAYTYDQTNEATKCITGEEDTCVATTCLESKDANSCPAGTIVRYAVSDTESKYFHVIEDKGTTMTMQQRENTINNVAWYAEETTNADGTTTTTANNTKGPLTILPKLEEATSTWTNVNDQTYTMGTTVFKDNAFTGCSSYNSCTTNTYTLDSRTAKARMITIQETLNVGCTGTVQSCPIWMHNYLYNSTQYGGTVNENTGPSGSINSGYWTISAYSLNSLSAWRVFSDAYAAAGYTYGTFGARAVVEINK